MLTMADQCRIAVALTVLAYKPNDYSFEAYIRILFDAFPADPGFSSEDNRKEDTLWKEKALSLEKQLSSLQQNFDEEHAELLLLRVTAANSRITASEESAIPKSVSTHGSKKQKKKTSAQKLVQNHEIRRESTPKLLDISNPAGLLASLDLLDAAALHLGDISKEEHETLYTITERSLATLSTTLTSLITDTKRQPKPELIDDLAILLGRLLTFVVPKLHHTTGIKLKRKRRIETQSRSMKRLDAILGKLATDLLLPLVRSFATHSQTMISAVFAPQAAPPKNRDQTSHTKSHLVATDLRPHMLTFFQCTINSFLDLADSFSSSNDDQLVLTIQGIFETVLLTACSAMEDLYISPLDEPDNPRRPSYGPLSNSSALLVDIPRKLARKDTLWYLCSLMHLLIPATATMSSLLAGMHIAPTDCSETSCTSKQPAAEVPDKSAIKTPITNGAPIAEEICKSLSRLLSKVPGVDTRKRRRRVRDGLQETERSMVLAVAEQVWLCLNSPQATIRSLPGR